MNWHLSLWEQSATAALMIIVVLLCRRFGLYRLPKQTLIVLWGLVWVRLLLPVSFTLPWPSVNSTVSWPIAADYPGGRLIMGKPGSTPADPVPAQLEQLQAALTDSALETWTVPLLFVIWLIGCIGCALMLFVPHIKARRIYNESLPVRHPFFERWKQAQTLRRTWTIRQSDAISTPLTYGWLRPVLLLPRLMTANCDEGQMSMILQHEFIHIKRMDVIKKGMLAVAVCVHWFNPLVWLMYKMANRDIELACDEAVIRTVGDEHRAAYARTLVHWQEQRSTLISMASHFSKYAVEERVVAIMSGKKYARYGLLLAVVTVAVTAVIFAMFGSDRSGPVREEEEAAASASAASAYPAVQGATNEYMPYDVSFSQDDVPQLMEHLHNAAYRAIYADDNVYLRVANDDAVMISLDQGATWREEVGVAIEGAVFADWLQQHDPIPGYSMQHLQDRLAAGADVRQFVLAPGKEIYVISDEQGVQLELVQTRKEQAAVLDGQRLMLTAERMPMQIDLAQLRSFYDLLVASKIVSRNQASLDYSDRVAHLQRAGMLDEAGQSAPVAGATISSTDGRVLDVSLQAEGMINFSVLSLQQDDVFTLDVSGLQAGVLEVGLLSIANNQIHTGTVNSEQNHVSITVPESGEYRIYLHNLANQRAEFQLELGEAIEGPIV